MAPAIPSKLSERQARGAGPARAFGRWQPPGRGASRQLDEALGHDPSQSMDTVHDALDMPYVSNQTQVRASELLAASKQSWL